MQKKPISILNRLLDELKQHEIAFKKEFNEKFNSNKAELRQLRTLFKDLKTHLNMQTANMLSLKSKEDHLMAKLSNFKSAHLEIEWFALETKAFDSDELVRLIKSPTVCQNQIPDKSLESEPEDQEPDD
jgi:hypothetical protein